MSRQSPLPGMDPFLEEASVWSGVHHRLISSISDQLAAAVSPNFFVSIEQRVYIVVLDKPARNRVIIPDVYLVTGPKGESQAAVQEVITPPTLIEPLYDLEIRDRYINIQDSQNRAVVTTIELLSPFNKTPGAQGYDAFQDKRKIVMASQVHWLEIDLLRAGERPPEVANQSDYYALLKRGDVTSPYETWFFNLRDTMPTLAVPLLSPFEDVPLNLQNVFNTMYTRAYYADSIDYTQNIPLPPLQPADAIWVKAQVSEKPPTKVRGLP